MAFLDNILGNKQQPESLEEELDREEEMARDNRGRNTDYQPPEDIQLTDEQMNRLRQIVKPKPVIKKTGKLTNSEIMRKAEEIEKIPQTKESKYEANLKKYEQSIKDKMYLKADKAAIRKQYKELTAREQGAAARAQIEIELLKQKNIQNLQKQQNQRQNIKKESPYSAGSGSYYAGENSYNAGKTSYSAGSGSYSAGSGAYSTKPMQSQQKQQSAPDNRSAMDILFGDRMNTRSRAPMQKQSNPQRGTTHLGGLSVLHAASTGQFKAGYGAKKPSNPTKIYKAKRK